MERAGYKWPATGFRAAVLIAGHTLESSGEAKEILMLGLSPEVLIYLVWEVAWVSQFLKALQLILLCS